MEEWIKGKLTGLPQKDWYKRVNNELKNLYVRVGNIEKRMEVENAKTTIRSYARDVNNLSKRRRSSPRRRRSSSTKKKLPTTINSNDTDVGIANTDNSQGKKQHTQAEEKWLKNFKTFRRPDGTIAHNVQGGKKSRRKGAKKKQSHSRKCKK